MPGPSTDNQSLLAALWSLANLPGDYPATTVLGADAAILPSSFRVGDAAQVSIAAAASAAALIYSLRSGESQQVTVNRPDAERECTGLFRMDGETPNAWEKFSGLYETADGHVRVHANFEHHRDGALKLLGFDDANATERADVEAALRDWRSQDFETAAAEAGLAVSALRTFDEWDAHPHAIATRDEPVIKLTRLDDAPVIPLPGITTAERPLSGVRILDLTRILAGPICGRTLAAYGADVMLVNAPHLPNIAHVIDTSRGKRSVHLDLRAGADKDRFLDLARSARVLVQGYRPGAMQGLGLAPRDVANHVPGIVYVSLSAYGQTGPWTGKRGFDSLVQTATGFNHAEADAAGSDNPRPLPVQILDYASGFLMAFGAQAALYQQQTKGGSWHVEVSLLQTANWLRRMGRTNNLELPRPSLSEHLQAFPCHAGYLEGMPHGATFEKTPATWQRPSSHPGTDEPVWSAT